MDPLSFSAQYEKDADGIFAADREGRILYMNQAALPFAGGAGNRKLPCPPLTAAEQEGCLFYTALVRALASRRKVSLLQKGPGGIHYLITASPVSDPADGISYVLCRCAKTGQHPGLGIANPVSWEENYPLKEASRGQSDIENFDFATPTMRKVLQKVEKAAKYDASVILLGESGVGKNVIANLIHSLSNRKNSPFIYINCGAIPSNLLESELFGYEKGAFTGATNSHTGLIERAQAGTLFFDEVAELPFSMQAKILHFLNDKIIYKISGKKPIFVDTRVISATNKNLSRLVESNLFREDLYYRLNVLKVEIPPLRERPEDLMILINHYFTYFNNKYCLNKSLLPESYRYLLRYSWPGNIRELRNIIEQLIILSEKDDIGLEDFPPELSRCDPPAPSSGSPFSSRLPMPSFSNPESLAAPGAGLSLDKMIEDYECVIFRQLYEKHASSYKIAKLLQISQTKANRKLQKYCR